MTRSIAARICVPLVLVLLAMTAAAQAPPDSPVPVSSRWDISLELPMWPSLQDLQPAAGGAFDPVGAGIGAAWHFPVRRFADSELLFGIDGFIAATESNIRGSYEDLLARHLYLGGSLKWFFGEARNLSLDAGLGYHEIDMAQVRYSYWGTYEAEHWSSSRAGGYLGMTWDAGAGRPDRRSGLSLGWRVHFVDFGRVSDEDAFFRALGSDAGRLEGPLYVLRIAYSGR